MISLWKHDLRLHGLTMAEIGRMIAGSQGVPLEEMKGPCRTRKTRAARQVLISALLGTGRYGPAQIARFLGVDKTAVYYVRDPDYRARRLARMREQYQARKAAA